MAAGLAHRGVALSNQKPETAANPSTKNGAGNTRIELIPPPHSWISWTILVAYFLVAFEGVFVLAAHPFMRDLSFSMAVDTVAFARVQSGMMHLCGIYVVESLMAVGLGWCAMSPGWTKFDLLVHHVPYVAANALAFLGGHAYRWTAPMAVVMITPLNEALFIAMALGAPDWVAKYRRLFGFIGITLLFSIETWVQLRNHIVHLHMGQEGLQFLIVDQVAWGGIVYHALLLRMYVRRWKKTRCL